MVRKRNVIIVKAGGHSPDTTKAYRISLPAQMVRDLGVTADDRGVILECDDGKITITKDRGNG